MQAINSYGFDLTSLAQPFAHAADQNSGDIAAELDRVIAARASDYRGPISSAAGKMLWAIQSWYAESNDESAIDTALGERTVNRFHSA